jgi:hypothetical protein
MVERRIFDKLETGAPDPRQELFRTALASFGADGGAPVRMIPMQGFRASHIDLGWIQQQVLSFVVTHPGIECNEVCEQIEAELPMIIQRLKSFSIVSDDWPESVELEFETKDDVGSYHYRLRLPVD